MKDQRLPSALPKAAPDHSINGRRATHGYQQDPDDSRRRAVQDHRASRTKPQVAAGRAARSSTTSRCVELRYPGSQERRASIRPPRSRTGSTTPMTGEQTKVTYAERFQHQYQQFKAAGRADQVRHAAGLRAVPDRGTPRRAAGAEHLHRRGAGRDRRPGAEEPRPWRPRAEEQGDGVSSPRARPARRTRRCWPSWRRCAPRTRARRGHRRACKAAASSRRRTRTEFDDMNLRAAARVHHHQHRAGAAGHR